MPAERSTVLVTGGAGFIGSELVRQLAARGERVVIVDSLVNGKRESVADVLSRNVAPTRPTSASTRAATSISTAFRT